MPLIPARIFSLCPIVSTGMLRILQFGKEFGNAAPPSNMAPGTDTDWPYCTTLVNNPSAAAQGLDCDTLKAVATSLGLSTQGGMHSQLCNLLKLDTSANPDCSVDTGGCYAEHGRTTVPDASYKSHHADLVLQRAHYKTKDPRPAASLCALIELLAEHDEELTEQVLLLSASFGTARTLYLQSGMKDVAHNFFSTNLYHMS